MKIAFPGDRQMPELISIVVIGRNEEENIARCLESCLACNWDNKEIIYCDSESTDGTVEIAKRYPGQVKTSTAGAARKLGEIFVGKALKSFIRFFANFGTSQNPRVPIISSAQLIRDGTFPERDSD